MQCNTENKEECKEQCKTEEIQDAQSSTSVLCMQSVSVDNGLRITPSNHHQLSHSEHGHANNISSATQRKSLVISAGRCKYLTPTSKPLLGTKG